MLSGTASLGSGRCDNGDTKDLLCHFIWGAAEWSAPGRLCRVTLLQPSGLEAPHNPPASCFLALGRIRCEFLSFSPELDCTPLSIITGIHKKQKHWDSYLRFPHRLNDIPGDYATYC